MDLPIIDTPVAPRWVWIEEITYSHIPIATIVTAFMVLAPIFASLLWVGVPYAFFIQKWRKRPAAAVPSDSSSNVATES